jgi:SOS-response transcriptional repressor LexA
MSATEIQKRILEKLRQAISSGKTISLRDLGGIFDVAPNTILYHIRKLEEQGFVVRDINGKVARVNSPDENSAVAFLPLLGSAACGKPLEEIADESTVRMIPIPLRLLGRNTKKQLYLVKAIGDSMKPKIEEEDIVIFENKQPQPGDIVVARLQDGFTIKVFKETQEQFILNPLNKDYEPFVFDKDQENEEFNIDGIAISVFKSQENMGGD